MKNLFVFLILVSIAYIMADAFGLNTPPLTVYTVALMWALPLIGAFVIFAGRYKIALALSPLLLVYAGTMYLLWLAQGVNFGNYMYALPLLAMLPLLITAEEPEERYEPAAPPPVPVAAGPKSRRGWFGR